jgi:hypothetical protein
MTSTELANIPEGNGTDLTNLNMQQIFYLGQTMVQAGMIDGPKAAAQAAVKIMAGQALGVDPVSSMRGIFIIGSTFGFMANLLASRIKGSGKYDYRVLAHTDEVCTIQFYEIVGGKRVELGTEKFTIEDAKHQGTKNIEKYAKNMLFARALSNGAKFHCPDVMNGLPIQTEADNAEPMMVDSTTGEIESAEEIIERQEADKAARREHAAHAGARRAEAKQEVTSEPTGMAADMDENGYSMHRADGVPIAEVPTEPEFVKPTQTQTRRIMAQLNELGFKTDDEKHAVYTGLTAHESFKELSAEEAPELIGKLQQAIDNNDAEGMRVMFVTETAL